MKRLLLSGLGIGQQSLLQWTDPLSKINVGQKQSLKVGAPSVAEEAEAQESGDTGATQNGCLTWGRPTPETHTRPITAHHGQR